MKKNQIIIFTDGASRGNPGPGGYGAIIYNEKSKEVAEIGGSEKHTTNNRMELSAAIEALLYARKFGIEEKTETTIHTDSAYVLNGITKWVKKWQKNNWMTGQKEGVLNQDLWQALIELVREREINGELVWKKISGHSGILGNERSDEIATSFADGVSILLFSGTISDYEKMLGAPILDINATKTKKRSSSKSSKNKGKKAYSYVSAVGKSVHIDHTWAECEKRVKGMKGAKYKKAMNKEEEQELVALYSLGLLESLVE